MSNLPLITKELTKTQIKAIADNSISEILENGNVIEVADTISKMEYFIKELKGSREFIDYVRDEVTKFGKDFKTSTGTKIELMESGIKYDYTQCGDSEWELLNQQIDSLKTQIADREKFLKALPLNGEHLACKMTGEINLVFPPSKSSTSTYKVTLAK